MEKVSFSEQVKSQILKNSFEQTCCKISALSAFVRGAGTLCVENGLLGFEAVTENKLACSYFNDIILSVYGESAKISTIKDKLTKRTKYILRLLSNNSFNVLADLGIVESGLNGTTVNLSIDKYLIENQCCKKAYIIGAFIGSGSVTVPLTNSKSQTRYHLDFVFSNYQTAGDFSVLMSNLDFMPRQVERKESHVVYFKNRQEVCDLLFFMGAKKSYFEVSNLMIEKDIRNETNRRINCEMANIEKQINASLNSIASINAIEQSVGLDVLPAPLKEVAIMRKGHSDATLSELASILNVSKSCLNHRLRKIAEIAKNL